jgi:hypothetical protein
MNAVADKYLGQLLASENKVRELEAALRSIAEYDCEWDSGNCGGCASCEARAVLTPNPHIDQIVYLSDQVSELDALVTHWASRAARAEDALREFRYLENREYQIGSMYFQDLITKVFEQIPPQHPWVGSTPSGETK